MNPVFMKHYAYNPFTFYVFIQNYYIIIIEKTQFIVKIGRVSQKVYQYLQGKYTKHHFPDKYVLL